MAYYIGSLNKQRLIIVIAYTLAQSLMLFNNGLFWDDWTLYNVESSITKSTFTQLGFPLIGYFHNFMLSFTYGIYLYRIVVFVSYLFSALLLHSILQKIPWIQREDILYIVLCFALFPVNSARNSIICSPYAISYVMFFGGFCLLSCYLEKRKIYYRISSLLLFYVSFLTNSLLVFYLIPILYLFDRTNGSIRIPYKQLVRTSVDYLDYLLLPIIFWVIKQIYFQPYGLYESYNKIDMSRIIFFPYKITFLIDKSFVEVIVNSVSQLSILNGITVLVIAFFLLRNREKRLKVTESRIFIVKMVLIGFIMFILAIIAYFLVGIMPQSTDWDSRHQLLIPLGASFMIIYGLKLILRIFTRRYEVYQVILILLIISFGWAGFNSTLQFHLDWLKQQSLMEHMSNSDLIRNNSTFLFEDQAIFLNANQRTYRFYEYSGMMKNVYGDETRFGESAQKFLGLNFYSPYMNSRCNLKDYKLTNPEYKVVIKPGVLTESPLGILHMVYLRMTNAEQYEKSVKKLVSLEFYRLN